VPPAHRDEDLVVESRDIETEDNQIGAVGVSPGPSEAPHRVGFVIGASVAFALGGAFMKASAGFSRLWPSLAVISLFVLGAFLLTRAVRVSGLATAYTSGLAVEALLTILVAIYWFGERLTPTKLISIALIVIGVAGVRGG
jgi:multidrug transporter EmrE-like cation transporter